MSFFQYLPGNSIFHRLEPETKILVSGGMTLLAFWFNDMDRLFALLVIVSFFVFAERIPIRLLKQILILSMIAVFFFTLWSSIFYPGRQVALVLVPRSILKVGELRMTFEGAFFGLTASLRLLVVTLSWTVMAVSTRLTELLGVMRRLHVPLLLSFASIVALRFFPVLVRDFYMIMDAQKSRGLELQKGIVRRATNLFPVVVPFTEQALSRSEQLAVAMASKGFGKNIAWAPLEESRLTRLDVAVIASTVISLIIAILLSM